MPGKVARGHRYFHMSLKPDPISTILHDSAARYEVQYAMPLAIFL